MWFLALKWLLLLPMGYMPPQRHNNGVNIHLLPDRNEVKLTTVSKAPFSYLLRRRWWDFGIPWMPRWLATRHHYHLFLYHHHQDAVARAKRVADCLPLAPPASSSSSSALLSLQPSSSTTLLLFSQSVDIGRTVYKTNDGRFSRVKML